jgi:tRNA pseudouridine-54 N-methylase
LTSTTDGALSAQIKKITGTEVRFDLICRYFTFSTIFRHEANTL